MDTPLASRLDPTLAQAAACRAQTVNLMPDAPVELLTPKGALVGETFAAEEFEAVLREVTPPLAWRNFEEAGQATFPLLSPYGHFLVTLWRDGESLRATIQPALGDAGESAPPEPSAFSSIAVALIATLIVVGAVVLIMPVIFQPPHPHRTPSSLNNIKRLALSAMVYALDQGDVLPGWASTPDGRYVHNVWDEQIARNVKSNEIFKNKGSGYKSPTDPRRERVLTYGLNGRLLVKTPTGRIGEAVAAHESGRRPPVFRKIGDVGDPAGTILLAELATETAVKNGADTRFTLDVPGVGTDQWNAALGHWIDISPREWVENGQTAANAYDPNLWDPTNGVTRDFYGGGGNYAFVDGHVQFMKIGDTVGLGKTYTVGKTEVTVAPGRTAWSQDNIHNLWNPDREP